MKNRRFLGLVLVVVLLLSMLGGCAKASDYAGNGAMLKDEIAYSEGMEEEGLSKPGQSEATQMPANQKLIRKLYMDAETEDMDALLSQVEKRIAELGGYVENRQVYNGSSRNTRSRNAELTIRIPAQQLDQFVDQIGEVSNVTSLRETTEDVTLSYVATESRIAALETEETRLLELLAMAEDMDDLLLIESKLADIRTELSQVKSTLKLYDNQVSYGTVYLSVDEVKEYTPVEETDGFFVRIGKGFVKSLKGVWNTILAIVEFLIISLPYFAFVGLILFLIILPFKLRKKRKNKKENK